MHTHTHASATFGTRFLLTVPLFSCSLAPETSSRRVLLAGHSLFLPNQTPTVDRETSLVTDYLHCPFLCY